MKLRFLILPLIIAAFTTQGFAKDIPRGSRADNRIKMVNYNPMDVVQVIGTIRTTVQVVFSQSEEIIDIGAGDSIAWEIVPRANILYLKARETNPPTNLQVATIRADGTTRTYSFELITRKGSITHKSDQVYFQVRFRYPTDEQNLRREKQAKQRAAAKEAAAREYLAKTVATTGTKNWCYLVAGSYDLQPISAYDNGDLTVLTFRRQTRFPSVFLVDDAGIERSANVTIRKNQIIIHAVAPEIRLRLGKKILAIYNEGINAGHTDVATGTTSFKVRREVIGAN